MPSRMTRRERGIVDRIDGVLATVASLQPSNPADLKAKIRNFDMATAAARHAHRAVMCWRSDDLATAGEELTAAERTLGSTEDPPADEATR